MALVKNISNGPRGAYLKGELKFAKVGEVIEADDFPEEWFEEVAEASSDPAPKAKGKPAAEPAKD